jgi:hypothetical protein
MSARNCLVPFELLSPGFEAVYTGEMDRSPGEVSDGPTTLVTGTDGKTMRRWSTWTWTWPGQEADWDEDVRLINDMQAKLGHLDDATRQIRAHIASLVPCDNGFPVTVDELLSALGEGRLRTPSFHNGCWMAGMWWAERSTQPFHDQSMAAIEQVLLGYLEGKSCEELAERFPFAQGFIGRTYGWLGPANRLSKLQRLLLERMLLPFEFFARRNSDPAAVSRGCFEKGGRGALLDAEIAALAGLPEIIPDYVPQFRQNLAAMTDEGKRELYSICCHIAHGLHGLSDCHHSTFRWIESWIHGIGTGRWDVPTRAAGVERERLGRLLFGYVLGLDKWLLGAPMQFLLLDLGHANLGFDPKNEILRVYANLGEDSSPTKEWLCACLWYTLLHNPMSGNPAGLVRHAELLERAALAGISIREWMDRAHASAGGH